jgi:hypothetical protein
MANAIPASWRSIIQGWYNLAPEQRRLRTLPPPVPPHIVLQRELFHALGPVDNITARSVPARIRRIETTLQTYRDTRRKGPPIPPVLTEPQESMEEYYQRIKPQLRGMTLTMGNAVATWQLPSLIIRRIEVGPAIVGLSGFVGVYLQTTHGGVGVSDITLETDPHRSQRHGGSTISLEPFCIGDAYLTIRNFLGLGHISAARRIVERQVSIISQE